MARAAATRSGSPVTPCAIHRRAHSNWRATGTLEDELIRQHIVGIAGIDTRALVRHLRSRGSMKAGVFYGDALAEPAELLERVRGQQSMLGADLAGEVSTAGTYMVEPEGAQRFTVAAVDLGIKTNTPRNFARRGVPQPRAAGVGHCSSRSRRDQAGWGLLVQWARRPEATADPCRRAHS